MPPASGNSYDRKYGARSLTGYQMDREVDIEHIEMDEFLNDLGIPSRGLAPMLDGTMDVLRRTVVDPSTGKSGTFYDIETPVGEFTYEIEN